MHIAAVVHNSVVTSILQLQLSGSTAIKMVPARVDGRRRSHQPPNSSFCILYFGLWITASFITAHLLIVLFSSEKKQLVYSLLEEINISGFVLESH